METTELATVKENSRQLDHMRNDRLDDSLFSKDLAPHYMKLATQLASSEMVPKCFRGKPQDLFIAWSLGYQIGMPPEQAMQCIAVINGKAAMWGDDMLALCMAHKDFEDIIEEPILKDGKVFGYTCTVKRKGREPKSNKFDLNDAKRAGLVGKAGPWTQYEERMLKLRARGFTLRDAFPDALKGIKAREEVEDYIEAEYKVVDNSNLSRTEQLKRDYASKADINNLQQNDGSPTPTQDNVVDASADNLSTCVDENQTQEETPDLHLEIKRLIEEKGILNARVEKALAYYEVNDIDELNMESCNHFIQQLLKS